MLAFLFAQTSASLAKTTPAPDKPSNGRLALVVGISSYKKLPELKNPVNDSGLIADTLRELGFEVVEKQDLTREQFKALIKDTSKKAKNFESILFYFAGHGFQLDGRNYLVPSDAKLEDRTKIPNETLQLDEIIKDIQSRDHNTLILLDACRNNPIPVTAAMPASVGGLAQMETGNGTFVAFATQPGNITRDGAGQNSPFSLALSEHMKTEGISISDMMIRVRNTVEERTLGTQTPWDQSSLRSQFYFNPAEEDSESLTEEDLALLEQLDPALREKFMKRFGLTSSAPNASDANEVVATITPSLRIEAAEPEAAEPEAAESEVAEPEVAEPEVATAEPLPKAEEQVPAVADVPNPSVEPQQSEAKPRKPGLMIVAIPDEELQPFKESENPVPAAASDTTLAMLATEDQTKETLIQPDGGKPANRGQVPAIAVQEVENVPLVSGTEVQAFQTAKDSDMTVVETAVSPLLPKDNQGTSNLASNAEQPKNPVPTETTSEVAQALESDPVELPEAVAATSPAPTSAEPTELAMLTPTAKPVEAPVLAPAREVNTDDSIPAIDAGKAKVDELPVAVIPTTEIETAQSAPATNAAADATNIGVSEPSSQAKQPDETALAFAKPEPQVLPTDAPVVSPVAPLPTAALTALLAPSAPMLSPSSIPALAPELPTGLVKPEAKEQILAMAKPEENLPLSPMDDISGDEKATDADEGAGLVPLPDKTEDDKRLLAISVQKELSRLGCYRSEPDGDWGSKSARALLRFYAEQKLEPDQLEPTQALLDRISRVEQVVCKVTIAPKPKAPSNKIPANKTPAKKTSPVTVQSAPAKAKPIAKAPPKAVVKQVAKPAAPAKPKPPAVAKANPPPKKKLTDGALIGAFR